MSEGPAGHYSTTIPALYPDHGNAHVHIELTGCSSPSTVSFDIYIDPSGSVEDTAGHPITGATVTLLRSSTADGPFAAVQDGSAVMSVSNRHNSDTTDSNGRFGWDVIPGFYKVRAMKAGCHAPGDPDSASVETAVLTIPPPVTDLLLVLDCQAADTTAPTLACQQPDGTWHADNVSLRCTAADDGSGLAHADDAVFTLQTSVPAGEDSADAATGAHEVCDEAGNCATAGPLTGNRIDRRAPRISCDSADDAWHAANVSVRCTATDDGSGLAHADDASIALATHVPAGAETADAATDTHEICDAIGNCRTAGPVTNNKIDRAAPTLGVPSAITTNATAPAGAAITFSATASDGTDPHPTVTCVPASGTTFPIGMTAVSCTATDHAGNTTRADFTVKVKSASEQIVDLASLLRSVFSKPALSDAMAATLKQAADKLLQRKPQAACLLMNALVTAVKLTPPSLLSAPQRALLISEASRIRAVIGC